MTEDANAKVRIYLDNCCYNRPYDDQSQLRIRLETQAKLYIQSLIKDGQYELVTSFVLDYENSCNFYKQKRNMIQLFIDTYSSLYVGDSPENGIAGKASAIMKTGVKEKDAYHLACAMTANCRYFITTDDKLLKYKSERIELVSPGDFIRKEEWKP